MALQMARHEWEPYMALTMAQHEEPILRSIESQAQNTKSKDLNPYFEVEEMGS